LQKKPEPAPRGARGNSGEWQKPEMLRLDAASAELGEGAREDAGRYS